MKHLVILLIVLGLAASANAALLTDDFSDNDISDWTVQAGTGWAAGIGCATKLFDNTSLATISKSFAAVSSGLVTLEFDVTIDGDHRLFNAALTDSTGKGVFLSGYAGELHHQIGGGETTDYGNSGTFVDYMEATDRHSGITFSTIRYELNLDTGELKGYLNATLWHTTTVDLTGVGDISVVAFTASKKIVGLGNVIISVPSAPPAPPAVTGRYVFYNNSAWDQNNPSPNTADYVAIATDKAALLPGEVASFANYTSYSKGINGIIIDIAHAPSTPIASDFTFKVGNVSDPSGFTTAPEPVIIIFRRLNGKDRTMITFADGAIAGKWLQVTVKATATTGLSADDVFYFGNAIGETGNSVTDAEVTPADEIGVRNNPRNLKDNPAAIDDAYDFNRDKKIGPTDCILCRNNGTNSSTALQLITAP